MRLNDLVPKYISKVPKDPFDGKPIRYSAKNKMIYSVGNDLKDSGGSEKDVGKGRRDGKRNRNAEDIVFKID